MFVARQWIRHRMSSVNEYSGRYSLIPQLFYTPEPEQLQGQSQSNRQGRGGEALTALHPQVTERWRELREQSARTYEWLVGEDVARELARIDLPLSTYTQWYWKIDLHNMLRFIALRADAHAQYEIQVYAQALADLTRRWVPDVYEAFVDYQMEGASLSRMEVAALRALLAGGTPDLAALGMSAREQVEFRERFHLK